MGSGPDWASGGHTETLADDGQVSLSLASGRGQVRPLAAASHTKLGSWSLGFSQEVKFYSLTLHMLPQKARKRPDQVADCRRAAVIFRPFYCRRRGSGLSMQTAKERQSEANGGMSRAGPWHVAPG